MKALYLAGRERWHGTVGGYTNHACRCPACTTAQRHYLRAWRARTRSPELGSMCGGPEVREHPRPESEPEQEARTDG